MRKRKTKINLRASRPRAGEEEHEEDEEEDSHRKKVIGVVHLDSQCPTGVARLGVR